MEQIYRSVAHDKRTRGEIPGLSNMIPMYLWCDGQT